MITTISALYPDLDPDVRVVDSFIEQLALLSAGEIDAAFVYLPVPEDFHAQPLTSEPRLVCVAGTNLLAHRSSVRLANLRGYPVWALLRKHPAQVAISGQWTRVHSRAVPAP